MTVTAILSALAEEQQGLLEQLNKPQSVRHGGRDFWLGELNGHRVVLGLSRIGKVAAATTATTLITRLGVNRIVFTGVAGGVGAGVSVGDVVVAAEFVQHDMDASPIFPRFEVPLYGKTCFACDPALTEMLLDASRTALAETEQGQARLHRGLIASGDRFVSAADESRGIQRALREAGLDVLAVEMEGAAVAQVCFDFGVPFAAVRTISDRADDQAHVDFPKFVAEVASGYAQSIMTNLFRLL
ncbi:MAG TPA: 5'-methylthioadenosine/adenosylhomocysteine nucleosidase [Burkholderiaceae bacterium]|nr:5'-methylthioadenosine/adenosylhomocysteine nucleosidase [Burkholderiaceae bacterium]